jgi:hypothetical protein
MRWKRFALSAALAAVLGLGLAFSLLPQATVASAQSSTQATSPGSALWGSFLDNLASALGIERSALDSAISSAGETTLDEAVAAGTLTQEQADAALPRVQAGDLGALMGGRGPGGRHGGARVEGLRTAMLDAAASTLGITSDELSSALRDGQTLTELAAAHTTTEQAVIDAALAAAKTKLDEAVAAGTLTQEQADAAYARLETAGANLLGGHGPGSRGPGGRGRSDEAPAPSTTPTAGSDV